MKNYFLIARKAIFEDYINLYLFTSNLLIFVIDFVVWKIKLIDRNLFIQTISGLYPIKYLLIVFIINTFLAIFSYEKEKEISYLLFSANLFIGILILVLELFYLVTLNGYA